MEENFAQMEKEALRMEEEALREMKRNTVNQTSQKFNSVPAGPTSHNIAEGQPQRNTDSNTLKNKSAEQKDLISFSDNSFDASQSLNQQSWAFFESNLSKNTTNVVSDNKKSSSWNDLLHLNPENDLNIKLNSAVNVGNVHTYERTFSNNMNFSQNYPAKDELSFKNNHSEFSTKQTMELLSNSNGVHRCMSSPHIVPLSENNPISSNNKNRVATPQGRHNNNNQASVQSVYPPLMSWNTSASFTIGSTSPSVRQAISSLYNFHNTGSAMDFTKDAMHSDIDNVFERWLSDNNQTDKNIVSTSNPETPKNIFDLDEWDPLHEKKSDLNQSKFFDTGNEVYKNKPNNLTQTTENIRQNQNTEHIFGIDCTSSEEYVNSIIQLCKCHPNNNTELNQGYLISPITPKWQHRLSDEENENTLKITIISNELNEPVVFSCTKNAAVEHVLSQALCIAFEDINQISSQDFMFKVAGREEYFINESVLSVYEYVQECQKYDNDVRFELIKKNDIKSVFSRSDEDDNIIEVEKGLKEIFNKIFTVKLSRETNQMLLEKFYAESEKLVNSLNAESGLSVEQHCDRVIQTVKATCNVMCGVETNELHKAIEHLQSIVKHSKTPLKMELSGDKDTVPLSSSSSYQNPITASVPCTSSNVSESLERVASALINIVENICKSVEIDSFVENKSRTIAKVDSISTTSVKDLLTINIVSLHRVPHLWGTMHDDYFVTCTLYHGDRELSPQIKSPQSKLDQSFNTRVTWNKWLTFPVRVSDLPRETKLCITLYGLPLPNDGRPSDKPPKQLAWINIALFNHNQVMKQGGEFFGMWVCKGKRRSHMRDPCMSNLLSPESIVLYLQMQHETSKQPITFPEFSLSEQRSTANSSLVTMDDFLEKTLNRILSRNPFAKLSDKEKDMLWTHRFNKQCIRKVKYFPRVLQCAKSWSPVNLQEIYQYVNTRPKLNPLEAIELLCLSFPDRLVRERAVMWMDDAEDDALHDCLIQLTQALRHELYHDNALVRFLFKRSLRSVRVAHKFYWLLNENCTSLTNASTVRYKLYFETLRTICGAKLRKEFDKEDYITKMVNRSAEAVQVAKDNVRMTVLKTELDKVVKRVNKRNFRLPTNPSFVANSIDVAKCSYFTSNAIPLKVVFSSACQNEEIKGNMQLMFKVGDDLRQDVLTMQLVELMNKLWLSEGLDLRIITFACLAVGEDRGWVELIPNSRTLREIQSKYGLTGAFKDRPISEWLQMHNPTGISYSKAEENFMLSCAGYCVATYILGICDRHNDNIMLRQSGHIFHIDFARFLGHAQMFGNIKRDRTPFVLTSDMAYVINGGDRKSSRFHDFIDICCRAFNIIRKNANLILNLLSLMVDSGMSELHSDVSLKYVYDALKPEATDTEATTMFTRLIETALSSSFTKINFFIHNLAQLRFNGSDNDKNSLSFASKTHTAEMDGIITDAAVVGYQKRYNPEKYYIYCIRLRRERRSGESYVFRSFDEFQELHEKLSLNFPANMLPNFPARVIVGRSQVKQVADRRKMQLNTYLRQLLHNRLSVSQCDLIYTFFQPLLRDEQDNSINAMGTVQKQINKSTSSAIGEIKMSLQHKNDALFVMIMHCKNLVSPDGSDPDPYVKTYLRPDPQHITKRKTKVARKTLHPTFNEMVSGNLDPLIGSELVYNTSLTNIRMKSLHVSVWNYEQFHENDFLGSVILPLDQINLSKEITKWYRLMTS